MIVAVLAVLFVGTFLVGVAKRDLPIVLCGFGGLCSTLLLWMYVPGLP